jgi:hypothetical protein
MFFLENRGTKWKAETKNKRRAKEGQASMMEAAVF